MKTRLFVLFLCLVVLSTSVYGLTASIGNARMILHTDAPTVLQKSIKVNNVNDIAVDILLTPTGDIEDFTEVLDREFTLQPGESKDARFVMRLEYGGNYDGKVLVNFKAADPEVKATPVGLASTVIILASGPENPNPPEEEPVVEPEEPEFEPEEPEVEPEEPEEPEEEPTTTPSTTTTEPTGPVKPKANPLVGIVIILFVLAVGAALYWWYMRR